MGHYIQGFIAKEQDLRRAASDLQGARVISLALGWGFLPLAEPFHDRDMPATELVDLVQLTARLSDWAKTKSFEFPIAYIETDYHGGTGSQSAVAWIEGQLALGPLCSDGFRDGKHIRTPLLDGAINQILRKIGVNRGTIRDEFDAVGLGRHRSNHSWLELVDNT
jgi:hypothetical protein